MRARIRPWMLGLIIFPMTAACADPTGAEGRREVGIVEWVTGTQMNLGGSGAASASGSPAVIAAPDEVQAGVPFEATITTFGLSTCWSADGADTQVTGNLAVVTPYDFTPEGGEVACGDAIIHLPRTVKLTFASAGQATVRVSGRKVVGGNTAAASTTVVEKQIVVR